MRKVRNITVAVPPDLYRQTRRLAAEYDSTVTAMVAYILQRLPRALKVVRFPVGGPKPSRSESSTPADAPVPTSAEPPAAQPASTAKPSPSRVEPNAVSGGTTVSLTPNPAESAASRHLVGEITAAVRQYDHASPTPSAT
jgi:hypothetical protein